MYWMWWCSHSHTSCIAEFALSPGTGEKLIITQKLEERTLQPRQDSNQRPKVNTTPMSSSIMRPPVEVYFHSCLNRAPQSVTEG